MTNDEISEAQQLSGISKTFMPANDVKLPQKKDIHSSSENIDNNHSKNTVNGFAKILLIVLGYSILLAAFVKILYIAKNKIKKYRLQLFLAGINEKLVRLELYCQIRKFVINNKKLILIWGARIGILILLILVGIKLIATPSYEKDYIKSLYVLSDSNDRAIKCWDSMQKYNNHSNGNFLRGDGTLDDTIKELEKIQASSRQFIPTMNALNTNINAIKGPGEIFVSKRPELKSMHEKIAFPSVVQFNMNDSSAKEELLKLKRNINLMLVELDAEER